MRIFRAIHRPLGLALLVGISTLGCSGGEPSAGEPLGALDEALYFTNSAAKWPAAPNHPGSGRGADITVCYTTPGATGGSPDETARVAAVETMRNWIENTWGRVADINFFNWKRCSGSSGGRIVIQMNKANTPSSSDLGYQGTARDTTVLTSPTASSVAIIHEFGHALGFLHEFMRDDWERTDQGSVACRRDADCAYAGAADFGPTCLKESGQASGYCRAPKAGTKLSATADFDSVMAATWVYNDTNASTSATPLTSFSPWDIIGVQTIYGPKPQGALVGLGGRCLDVKGASTAQDVAVIAWPCVGQPNDKFVRGDHPASGDLLKARISNKNRCLNVHGGVVSSNKSTKITTWDCDLNANNEAFEFNGLQLRTMGNQCVTASGTTAGSQVEIRECGSVSTDRERWNLVGDSIRLAASDLCASVPKVSGTTVNPLRTKVTLRSCAHDNGQILTLNNSTIKVGDKCWNVRGNVTTPGTDVVLWDSCNPGYPNDRFYVSGVIKSLGQCLDMTGGVSKDGANIGVYPCVADAPNEQWDYYW